MIVTQIRFPIAAWLTPAVLALILAWTGAWADASDDYLRQAEGYLEKGDLRAAVIQLKNALKEDPENARARLRLGETYLRLDEGLGAEKELRRARSLGMDPATVLVPLGKAYLLMGQHEKLLDEITVPADASAGLNAAVLVLRGQAQLALGKTPEARELFAAAQQQESDNTGALLGMARLAVMEKKFDEADAHLERALLLAPDDVEILVTRGELARRTGNFALSKESFEQAIELAPGNTIARLGRAATLIALSEYEAAQRDVDVVIQQLPQQPLANYLAAVISFRNKDMQASEEALGSVLRAAPDYLPAVLLMGNVLYSQGKYEQAKPPLARYLAAVPANTAARKLLAATLLQLGQPAEAAATLEVGVEQAQTDAQWLALLGTAYLKAGDPTRATEWLEKAVAVAPDLAVLRGQLALGHLYQGETSAAISELETAVDLGQGLFQSDVLLVLARLRNQELDQALAAAEGLVEKLPENPMAYNLLGAVYGAKGQTAEARQQFEKAIELLPAFTAAAVNLARLDLQEGRFDDAERRLKSVLARSDRNAGVMMLLADIARRRGQPDVALEWVQTAWEKNPGALQPGLVLAQHYLRQGENLKAIAVARELSKAHPKDPRPLQMMGTARLAMGEAVSAVSSYQRGTELQPNSPNAYLLLANAQAVAEDFNAAVASLEKALSLKPDYLPAQAALARLLQRAGNTDEALRLARQIQQQRPQNAQGYVLEGNVHWAGKDYGEAEKVLAVGYDRAPTADLALMLFQARRQLGDHESARAVLSKWVANHPNDLRVRQVLGQSHLETGDTVAAIEHYRVVAEGQPGNVVVLNNLAWALHEQNDPSALQYAEKAYELAPDQFEVADTLGWLLLERGEVQRGLALIRDAATKAPHVPSVRYHLGAALAMNDREAEARRELERLLRDHPEFPEADDAKALLAELQAR